MSATNQATTALLTEHFRYTPLTLLDDIINTVNELVFRAVNAIESGMENAAPESLGFRPDQQSSTLTTEARATALAEMKQNEIDSGIVQLESLLNATVDKDFDKFEIYTLRNILALGHEEDAELARWVRLDHYKELELDASSQLVTPEEVQLQRRKVHETAKLNAMLKAEEARNAAVLEQLQALLVKNGDAPGRSDLANPSLAFLTSARQSTESGAQSLAEDMKNAVAQLPAIRQYLAELKASLAAPASSRSTRLDDSAHTRRRDYLDSQSRKALERRGIDTEGSARLDAKFGRRVAREDVEGLEAVVQTLAGAET